MLSKLLDEAIQTPAAPLTEAKLKWEKKGDNIYGAIGSVTSKTTDGRIKKFEIGFRIDGRGGDGFRVDKNSGLGPWEAIDGGAPGLPSLAAAKAFVVKWMAAASEQQTLTPRNVTP